MSIAQLIYACKLRSTAFDRQTLRANHMGRLRRLLDRLTLLCLARPNTRQEQLLRALNQGKDNAFKMASNFTNGTDPWDGYFENVWNIMSLFSIIFLSLVSIGTVVANGFALYAIYKDPLKCFRTTLSVFITGILVSNFLTGLIVEPIFAFLYAYYYRDDDEAAYFKLMRISQVLSRVTINTSFMTVLMLAYAQLIGLRWSSFYVRYITPRLAVTILVSIWVYAIMFALIPEFGRFDRFGTAEGFKAYDTYFKVDLIMHTTAITVTLVVLYIAMYFVFQRAMVRYEASLEAHEGSEERSAETTPERRQQQLPKAEVEREFVKSTLIVIVVLIITVWPFTIMLYIWSYQKQNVSFRTILEELTAFVVVEDFMFLKFLLDPFIFVWRLPKYRKAIGMVYQDLKAKCGCTRAQLAQAEYHHAAAESEGDGEMHFADEEFMVESDSVTNPTLDFHLNEAIQA